MTQRNRRQLANLSERELLIIIAEDVQDLANQMWGNGQPGVVERLIRVEEHVTENTNWRRKAAGIGAITGGVTTLLLAIINELVVHLPGSPPPG